MSRKAIGIDLGTTNSTVASIDLDEAGAPSVVDITQVHSPGETMAHPRLPSFAYHPVAGEYPQGALGLPWDENREFVVGSFATKRAAEVPARVVSSAKSWLTHTGVDRQSALLPFGAPDDVPKISPVDASARYLVHLKEAAATEGLESPNTIVVCVPASFDPVARQLTEEAAERAGFSDALVLLEEPQAAMYAWLADHENDWRDLLAVGDTILVCDLGGGTTDFSLLTVNDESGSLSLDRIAVGEHILLGGDNMDLALAHRAKMKLEDAGKKVDAMQLQSLVATCRGAKERLLSGEDIDELPIAVAGRSSKLIGGVSKTSLSREEVNSFVLEGFFPWCVIGDAPHNPPRTGFRQVSLPYAQDAAITKHLAQFLKRHAAEGAPFRMPTHILFNGGVTRSDAIRNRILESINGWLENVSAPPVTVLDESDADNAVSVGAAYFARVREGTGIRIKGGTARSYYLGFERAELAIPGVPPKLDAICIAPFGLEEGSEVSLEQELGLVVGETARFRFFSSTHRTDDSVSALVDDTAELEELESIETTLEGDTGQILPVHVHARVSEVGTLELFAVHEASSRRWKLEFDVRMHGG